MVRFFSRFQGGKFLFWGSVDTTFPVFIYWLWDQQCNDLRLVLDIDPGSPEIITWIKGEMFFQIHSSLKTTISYKCLTRWLHISLRHSSRYLRIPDSYDAKIAKICNCWTFWPVIQLISTFYIYGALGKRAFCRILNRGIISWITCQNVQKLQIFTILAS